MENKTVLSELKLKQNDIDRGVDVIDNVISSITLPYSTMSDNKVMLSFAKIFAHEDDNLISHYLDKFIANNDKDFGRYYLSCDDDMIRTLFEYYKIPLETEKYSNNMKKIQAQIEGKDTFEIFPFEQEITRKFYLYANNHSLEALNDFAPEAFLRVKEKGINLYGNGIHWSQAWNLLEHSEKQKIVEFLFQY